MHLIIDGYNLLHVCRSHIRVSPVELQRERDRLIHQLSTYRQFRPCDITVVFDGWQGGWITEKREKQKGIELIFSKLGERADEVIKRLVKEKGAGAVVITSDREVARYAERIAVAVIPSDQFQKKIESSTINVGKGFEKDDEEVIEVRRKGPSRRLSKKERRLQAVLKKL